MPPRTAVWACTGEVDTELLEARAGDDLERVSRLVFIGVRKDFALRDGRRIGVVSSTNANYSDWAELDDQAYEVSKQELIETTLSSLEKYVPGIRQKVDHVEAATPKTFQHYTQHLLGASFGTKFEGLAVSRALPQQGPPLPRRLDR